MPVATDDYHVSYRRKENQTASMRVRGRRNIVFGHRVVARRKDSPDGRFPGLNVHRGPASKCRNRRLIQRSMTIARIIS